MRNRSPGAKIEGSTISRSTQSHDGSSLLLHDGDVDFAEDQLSRFRFARVILSSGEWKSLDVLARHRDSFSGLVVKSAAFDHAQIADLTNLRVLELFGTPQTSLRFGALTELRALRLEWSKEIDDSIGDLKRLEDLEIHWFAEDDLGRFERLRGLQRLLLIDARKLTTLRGIGANAALEALEFVSASKLVDVASLSELENLSYLAFEGCRRVDKFETLRSTRLRFLMIVRSFQLASLSFVARLPDLEYIVFGNETRVADGDITPLTEHPRLQGARFSGAPHYNLSESEVHDALVSAGRLGRDGRPDSPFRTWNQRFLGVRSLAERSD